MLRPVPFLSAILLTGLVAAPATSAGQSADSEAPVAFEQADIRWEYRAEKSQTRLIGSARVYKNFAVPLLEIRCGFRHLGSIHAIGLIPAQTFPQPRLSVRIGDATVSGIADASYRGRSAASSTPMPPLKFEKGLEKLKTLEYPGHPPYARLSAISPLTGEFLEALQNGEPIEVSFNGQVRRYPSPPKQFSELFAKDCDAVGPTVPPAPTLAQSG